MTILAKLQEKEETGEKSNTPIKVKILRIEEQTKAKSSQKTPAKRKRGSGETLPPIRRRK